MLAQNITASRKLTFVKILLSTFVFSVFLILASKNVFAQNIAVVSGETANAYIFPSFGAEIIARFEEGEVLDIISVSDNWITVSYGAETLYISMEFITVLQAEGLVIAGDASLKRAPSRSSDTMMSVNMGMVVTVTGICGDFYSVDYAGVSAYISKELLIGDFLKFVEEQSFENYIGNFIGGTSSIMNTYLRVTAPSGLNLRANPSTDAPVIAIIPFDTIIEALAIDEQWHMANYNGLQGYVSAEFIEVYAGQRPESGRRTQIINYAMQFLGTKYVWGGTNLSKGVDCSGFVYSVFKSIGITLNRTSRDQANNGPYVNKGDLMPGDLVFFCTTNTSGTISHVGIYIGNGNFIHSSSSSNSRGVVISSLNDAYYSRTYVKACRVIN